MVVVLRVLDDRKEDLPNVLLDLAHFFFGMNLDFLRLPAGLRHTVITTDLLLYGFFDGG